MGNATEQAYKEDADYYGGLLYGVGSGATEMATEKLVGGVYDGILSKKFSKGIADQGIKRVVKNAVGEGLEEMTSELANPLLQTTYKGTEAFKEYTNPDYLQGVIDAGVMGAMSSAAYGGSIGYILDKANKGNVGKNADISESLSEIDNQLDRKRDLETKNLTPEIEIQINENIKSNYKNIENILKNATNEQRNKFIKRFNLKKSFDTNGNLKQEILKYLYLKTIAFLLLIKVFYF